MGLLKQIQAGLAVGRNDEDFLMRLAFLAVVLGGNDIKETKASKYVITTY